MEDTNDDVNGADISKMATTKGLKRRVGIWLVLVLVIFGKRSTEVIVLIMVLTVGIGPIFVSVVGMA